jgi:hypothetical protein
MADKKPSQEGVRGILHALGDREATIHLLTALADQCNLSINDWFARFQEEQETLRKEGK